MLEAAATTAPSAAAAVPSFEKDSLIPIFCDDDVTCNVRAVRGRGGGGQRLVCGYLACAIAASASMNAFRHRLSKMAGFEPRMPLIGVTKIFSLSSIQVFS